eukprot:g8438.t1
MDLSKILSLKRQGDKDKYGGGGEKKKSSGFAEASNILKSSSKRGMSKAAVHPLSEGKSSLQNHAAAAAADHEPETMSSMDAMIRSEELPANFKVHGKELLFAPVSCCVFDESSKVRQYAIWLAVHPRFDNTILLMIVLNSIILALQDYSVVDPATLEPTAEGSWRNAVVEQSEPFFTWIFFFECALKIVAMGFVSGKGAYLRNGWNWLDFIVVVAGVLTLFDFPNVSAFRAIRVLRPLRSLTIVPGMKVLIVSLLSAIPQLLNVVALLMFMFFMFGILGVQIWSGIQHNRCRLTPFPIVMPPDNLMPLSADIGVPFLERVLLNPGMYRCNMSDRPGVPIPVENPNWVDMKDSPWIESQPCFWPSDASDERVCSLPDSSGDYECPNHLACGSAYDSFGNPRFRDPRAMRQADFVEGRNFGFTNFDNFINAFVTIFQCITMEGWVDVMYQLMDGHNGVFAAVYFTFLILFGSFFLLNLTLAVLWEQFDRTQEEENQRKSRVEMEMIKKHGKIRRLSTLGKLNKRLTTLTKTSVMSALKRCYKYLWPDDQNSPICCIKVCYKIATNSFFNIFIVFMIVANTVILSLDRFPLDKQEEQTMEWVNFSLSIVFAMEMVIKLLGVGIREYIKDFFNVFDAFIVISGTVELIFAPPWQDESDGSAVSALRSFRLFRVFKLARSWVSLRKLLQTIARTLVDIANFTVVLFLFIYIFALIGMQLFANKFRFDPETNEPLSMLENGYESGQVPRANFDTFIWAVATVFQVLTGENWNTIMYDGMRVAGAGGAAYFITLVVLGNFIVLNLFLAILLGNFENTNIDDDEEDELVRLGIKVKEKKLGACGRLLKSFKVFCCRIIDKKRRGSTIGVAEKEMGKNVINSLKSAVGIDGAVPEKKKMNKWTKLRLLRKFDQRLKMCRDISLKPKPSFLIKMMSGQTLTIRVNVSDTGATVRRIKGKIESATNIPPNVQSLFLEGKARELRDDEHPLELGLEDGATLRMVSLYSTSLYMFGAGSPFRIKLSDFVRSSLFDNTILVMIIISSLALAVDSPLLEGGNTFSRVLEVLDWILTIIFFLEMMLKIVASGFVLHRGSYLRNSWNMLDFLIVIISVLSKSGNASKYKWLKSLRTFRALRPLRMISRAPGMKLVVQAMLAAMPEMVNVVLVCILIFLIFAIVGVNNFKGRFYACQGALFEGFSAEQVHLLQYPKPYFELTALEQGWACSNATYSYMNTTTAAAATSQLVCEWMCGEWGPTIPQTFDNVGNGLLTLLEISTTEGWVDVMYNSVDATGIGMQPIENSTVTGPVLFYLGFMLVGCFFVMNLFVGVLLDNFERIKNELGENGLLTEAQLEWVRSIKVISKTLPLPKVPPPDSGIRKKCWEITQNPSFDEFIMGCIGVNTITMALVHIGAPETWVIFLQVCNYVFAFIFTVEAVLKLLALGTGYFCDDVYFGGIPSITQHKVQPVHGVRPPLKNLKISAMLQLKKLASLKTLYHKEEKKTTNDGKKSPPETHHHHKTIKRRKSFAKIPMSELNAIHNDKGFKKKIQKDHYEKESEPTVPEVRHVYNLWNIFDFTIVVGTLVGLFFQWTSTGGTAGGNVTMIAMIIRTFRICRIVRLVKRAKSLRMLFNTLLLTLPGLANVGSLLFLFLFIYAIMGVQIFAKAKLVGLLDDHANFQTLGNAMMTLIRCSTGEAWNTIMWDLSSASENCNEDPAYDPSICAFNGNAEGCVPVDGCGTPVAFPFFVSFTLLVTFIMLNMFIGIICDGFSEITNGESSVLSAQNFMEFTSRWQLFDPHATLYIRKDQLIELLKKVPEPFGFPEHIRKDQYALGNAVLSLGLPHYAGNYACYTDVATAMAKDMLHRSRGYQIEDLTLPDQHKQLVKFLTRFSVGHTSKMRTGFTTEHVYAAKLIMETYRVLRYRENLINTAGDSANNNSNNGEEKV